MPDSVLIPAPVNTATRPASSIKWLSLSVSGSLRIGGLCQLRAWPPSPGLNRAASSGVALA